jgi:hypothetical protein
MPQTAEESIYQVFNTSKYFRYPGLFYSLDRKAKKAAANTALFDRPIEQNGRLGRFSGGCSTKRQFRDPRSGDKEA